MKFKCIEFSIEKEFNEIFTKDVTYDDVESHQKPGLHPLFRRHFLKKPRRQSN